MESYKLRLEELEVSFGYSGIQLFSPKDIDKEQIGYSVDENNNSLTGIKKGDWKDTQVVIGCTIDLGDPVFIDTSSNSLPVFTAIHGRGFWEPEIISNTYEAFLNIMTKFSKISENREYPTRLEKNPITEKEYNQFIEYIKQTGQIQDAYFWELLVSDEESGIGQKI